MLAAESPRPFPGHHSIGRAARFPLLPVNAVRRIFLAAVGLPLVWLAGCATQADIQDVRSERSGLRSALSKTTAAIDGLRRDVGQVQDQVTDLRMRLDRVAQTRSDNAAQLDKLGRDLAALDTRLQSVESRPMPLPADDPDDLTVPEPTVEEAPPSLPFGGTPFLPPPTESAATTDTPVCDDVFRGALELFQKRSYPAAIESFRTFQRRCPDSERADDAQYWIGESHYVREDYNRAILEFNDVLSYRRGDRVPAALLRQAQAFLALGDKTDARLIVQKLASDYPDAAESPEAQELLQALGR